MVSTKKRDKSPSATPVPSTEAAQNDGSSVPDAQWEGMQKVLNAIYDYRTDECVFQGCIMRVWSPHTDNMIVTLILHNYSTVSSTSASFPNITKRLKSLSHCLRSRRRSASVLTATSANSCATLHSSHTMLRSSIGQTAARFRTPWL